MYQNSVSQMFGVCSLIPFIKKLGRKGALMVSCSVAAFGIILLGTYSIFYERAQSDSFINSTLATTSINGSTSSYVENSRNAISE